MLKCEKSEVSLVAPLVVRQLNHEIQLFDWSVVTAGDCRPQFTLMHEMKKCAGGPWQEFSSRPFPEVVCKPNVGIVQR